MWKRMTRILSRKGVEPRVSGFFFKSVVHAVLLFGAKTWVVTPPYGQGPGGVPGPGGAAFDGAAPAAAGRREVGIQLDCDSKGGGGF